MGTPPAGLEPLGTAPAAAAPARARYGYAIAPGSAAGLRMLAALLADSVRVWYAPRSFTAGGASFARGAFVVRVASNDSSVHARVQRHAAASGARVTPLASGAVEQGTDLGSNSVIPLSTPRVAIASGAPIAGQSYGYAWFAFDQRLRYPSTALDVEALAGAALDDFDVLVVPSVGAGAMARALGDAGQARVAAWVRGGGVLVTVDEATDWLASERLGLARLRVRRADSTRADSSTGAPLSAEVPGAIVRAVIDTLSPLMAGVEEREIPVQYFSDRIYTAPRDVRAGEVAARYAPLPRLRLGGYLWPEVPRRLAETPYVWTERVGRGRVIGFAGDPNYRDLWPGLMPMFGNAVLMGGSF
jgi:hypothetical protein